MPTKFFIGSSPSMASRLGDNCSGVMVSVNSLRKRKSDFKVADWILDSGAFTEISKFGDYRYSVDEYAHQINKWAKCGNLLIAVSQDYMCEPFILEKTGLTIEKHQELTINRYDALTKICSFPIMPVIQGYQVSDYLNHLIKYGDRFKPNQWVGVGSVCKRNSDPNQIKDILRAIKLIRSDLRLHGFGLKATALECSEIRSLLYSCDSMAWSYPSRFSPENDNVQNRLQLAEQYKQKIQNRINGSFQKNIPRTAGAGNGQGRKSKWKSGKTIAIRVPEVFADRLLTLAKGWDAAASDFVQNQDPVNHNHKHIL